MEEETDTPLLKMVGIRKSFDKNEVLKGIDLVVKAGEVHVLLGENGAGKSTLIKILTGVYSMDSGQIYWNGKKVKFHHPREAIQLGISTIYQELNNVQQLKVYENIFLGREKKRGGLLRFIDKDGMRNEAIRCLNELGQNGEAWVDLEMGQLGIGQQQLVEIAKAIALDAKLIIMDEPTSSLSGKEIQQLLKVIRLLKSKGVGIILITHKMDEIQEIGDVVTILRDGYMIQSLPVKTTNPDEWVRLMVGRSLDERYPKKSFKRGREGFRIENLRVKGFNPSVNFSIHYGEIVGLYGLVGAGRTEMARAIFGADPKTSGKIYINGNEVKIKSPRDAIEAGIALITEDRKNEGLLLDQPLDINITIASLSHYLNKKTRLLHLRTMKEDTEKYIHAMHIKTDTTETHARYLSGGNQQKAVIAKWLCTNAQVFIFDEPTRGIDVGAKVEVYRLMNELVDNGKIVLVISSELPEVLGMCDRVLVMNDGKITANMPIKLANQENIVKAATGA